MSLITANPIIDMLTEQQPSIFYLDDGTPVFKCVSNPEGVIEGNAGSLALQNNGAAYIKTTNGGNTGWMSFGSTGVLGTTNVTLVSTSGTGLDNLQSYTLPANVLLGQGDGVIIHFEGQASNNLGNKRWVFNVDGGAILDTGLQAIGDPVTVTYIAEMKIVMNTGNSADVWCQIWMYNNANVQIGSFGDLVNTGAGFNTNTTHTILCQGECANAGDTITQRLTVASKL